MTVQIEAWQLLSALAGLLLAFLGFAVGAGRMLLNQIDKRLDQRFSAVEEASGEWRKLEKDFLTWRADLPLQYVRREDYVRSQTVIEAKLDALSLKIENLQFREVKS